MTVERIKATLRAIVGYMADEKSRKMRMPLQLRREHHMAQIVGLDLAKWLGEGEG